MGQVYCKSCGFVILGQNKHDGFCPSCYKYEKAHESQKALVDMTVAARKAGMSYGQYQAQQYAQSVKIKFPWKETKE